MAHAIRGSSKSALLRAVLIAVPTGPCATCPRTPSRRAGRLRAMGSVGRISRTAQPAPAKDRGGPGVL
jgi:hypothetical protein